MSSTHEITSGEKHLGCVLSDIAFQDLMAAAAYEKKAALRDWFALGKTSQVQDCCQELKELVEAEDIAAAVRATALNIFQTIRTETEVAISIEWRREADI